MKLTFALTCFLAIGITARTALAPPDPDPKVLAYDGAKAHAYAVKYCEKGNDCPDGQYGRTADDGAPWWTTSTDCTHFIAHVLAAGGVKVSGVEASCKKGLMIRVRELPAWFDKATANHVNVVRVVKLSDTRAGDIAVLRKNRDGVLQPYHVVMLNDQCKEAGARVFGHEADRCGDLFIPFAAGDALFYRIESNGPFDGKWVSGDNAKRFRLEINGATVRWIERRASDGAELARPATLVARPDTPDVYVVSRVNDDEVLRFLDFPDAALRSAILAANPEPSTMTLRVTGGKVVGEWRGLAVRKKPNGTFDSLIQPSKGTPKEFTFSK